MSNTEIQEVEVWIDVIGYEGLYEISSYGRVRSLAKNWINPEKFLSQNLVGKYRNYKAVVLYKEGVEISFRVSRLVAQHFVPNPHNKPQVNHDDGNTFNNFYKNLIWSTCKENIDHAWKNGLTKRLTDKQYADLSFNGISAHWIRVKRLSTGVEYKSLQEASDHTGVPVNTISQHVNNKFKTKKWTRV